MSFWLPFCAALAAYAALLPPGLPWLDGGELSAAAVGLGIAHPTGFPLLALWAKAFSLLPVGELAFRLHLGNAVAAALALGALGALVARGVRALVGDHQDALALVAACAAAVLAGASRTVLAQSVSVEAYAPSLALWLGVLHLALAARARPSLAPLATFVGALGAAGLHAVLRVLALAPALWTVVRAARRRSAAIRLAPLTLTLGCAVLVYLPVRAATTPFSNWGDPRTAGRLWDHLSAGRIRRAFEEEIATRNVTRALSQAARTAGMIEGELGVLVLLLALAGAVALGRRRGMPRALSGWLLFGLAFDFVYAFWVNPMGLGDLQNGGPARLALACLAGIGLGVLSARTGRAAVAGAAAVGFVAAWPVVASSALALGATTAPDRWTQAALDEVPPRGTAFVTSDDLAAGIRYFQAAGQRPDVGVVVIQQTPARALEAALVHAGVHARWEAASDTRPPDRTLVPVAAPLWPVARKAHEGPVGELARGMLQPLAEDLPSDAHTRRVAVRALDALARLVLANGRPAAADALWEKAAALAPDSASALVNAAVAAGRRGETARALELVGRALELEPDRPVALVNQGRWRLARNQDAAASRSYSRANALDPGNAGAWAGLALVEARRGNAEKARQHAARALALDPADPEARLVLERLGPE